jgi:FdhD protein
MSPSEKALPVRRQQWRYDRGLTNGQRWLPEEMPIALSYRGCTYAVMMATPDNLQDFAVGFSLTEGIVRSQAEITDITTRHREGGIVLDIDLAPAQIDAFWERRHFLAGPSGCGLCGVESISQALRPCPPVRAAGRFSPADIAQAMIDLPILQALNHATHAVHGAGFWRQEVGMVAVREDVGRHNALDKLIGSLARSGEDASEGLVVLTSRVSVEMVQKAAAACIPVIVAVSSPTALAVRTADAAHITLVGVARDDGFEIFTHSARISDEGSTQAPQSNAIRAFL